MELQLEERFAQHGGEAAIGRIERRRLERRETQRGDGAAVVVYCTALAPARELDQRPLREELGVLRAVVKRHGRPREQREGLGIDVAQMLGQGEAVGKQALAAV